MEQTCKNCKHWSMPNEDGFGRCCLQDTYSSLPDSPPIMIDVKGYDGWDETPAELFTKPDFGCNQFQPRNTKEEEG